MPATGALPAAEKNLAAQANGGTLVWFTSKGTNTQLSQLTDTKTDTPGWRSKDNYLPQDFVFAFKDDAVASVGSLVLNPKTVHPKTTWATNFLVSVSLRHPLDGFEEVGQFDLTPEARDQSFPINKPARFVKIRLLKNGGGPYTSLGEIKILEGAKELLDSVPAATARAADAAPAVNDPNVATEQEPNNTATTANPLPFSRVVQGAIDRLGEDDYFKLTIPGSAPNVLTFDLIGHPHIRTSMELLDPAGHTLKRFDPGRAPARDAHFSWAVNSGDHILKVSEPVASMVLIWDTSDSMKDSIGNLKTAVLAYLDQVRPSERLKLIRYSRDVEVITPEFLSDPAKLKAAAESKFTTRSGTACYDAILRGISLLETEPGNRAIVLMTDGADSASKLDHPGLWRALREKRVRLYNIGLGSGLSRFIPGDGIVATRMLNHTALATDGRSFYARTPDELKGFYQTIADELRALSTYYLHATVSQGLGQLSVVASGEPIAAVSAPPLLELILDCSGSMSINAGARRRMDIARDAMIQIIRSLPDDIQVALRLYGHRIEDGKPGACEDSELVVPFGPIHKTNLIARVRALKPLGTTPIAYTIRQLAGDFRTVPGEKRVILVTDGVEDCQGKPAESVQELIDQGIKLRLDIVGFGFVKKEAKDEMEKVAALGGGQFHDAKDARTLDLALQKSLAVPYDVLDAAGTKIAAGLTGQGGIPVPEGIFQVVIHGDKPIHIPHVRVARQRATQVSLKKEAQELGIQITGP